jgi:predicted hydrocarbon binding protein
LHGIIFESYRDYVVERHGPELASELYPAQTMHLLSEIYPDEDFVALVNRTAAYAESDVETVLHDFGRYAAQTTFATLYPAFFIAARDARTLLLTVEQHIHEIVRATVRNAQPPRLHVSELGDDGVTIVYDSPRRLCALLRGLAEGSAAYYNETAMIEETSCMHRGDAACTFRIRLSPAA